MRGDRKAEEEEEEDGIEWHCGGGVILTGEFGVLRMMVMMHCCLGLVMLVLIGSEMFWVIYIVVNMNI